MTNVLEGVRERAEEVSWWKVWDGVEDKGRVRGRVEDGVCGEVEDKVWVGVWEVVWLMMIWGDMR